MNSRIKLKKWWKAAGIRAIKTMSQTVAANITLGMTLQEINWMHLISLTLLAGFYSIVMSLNGIPEVDESEVYNSDE